MCPALMRLKAAYDHLNARQYADDAIKPFFRELVSFSIFDKVLQFVV